MQSISSSATLDSQPTKHPPPSPIPDLTSSLNKFSIQRDCLFFHQISDRHTLYAAEDVFLGGMVMEEEETRKRITYRRQPPSSIRGRMLVLHLQRSSPSTTHQSLCQEKGLPHLSPILDNLSSLLSGNRAWLRRCVRHLLCSDAVTTKYCTYLFGSREPHPPHIGVVEGDIVYL